MGKITLKQLQRKYNLCQPTIPKYLNYLGIPFEGKPLSIDDNYLPMFEEFLNKPVNERKKLLTQKTCMEKYGVKSSNQLSSKKEKVKQTCIKKYGAISTLLVEEVKEKSKKTLLDRYGVENYSQSDSFKKKASLIYSEYKQSIKEGLEKQYGPLYDTQELCSILDKDSTTVTEYLKIFKDSISGGYCSFWFLPKNKLEELQSKIIKHSVSKGEYELKEFIKSLNINYISNDRTVIGPKELDIYIPEKKIALEFNGCYWHSDKNLKEGCSIPSKEDIYFAKNRHIQKTKDCENKGIRLIHIFEDDWVFKRDIIEDIIKQALGICERKIFARNCIIKKLNTKDYSTFLEKYHLQGYSPADIKLGLFYKEELVECIGIKTKGTHSNESELVRLCSKKGTNIVGGFSKLLKHSNFTNLVSYIDRATFSGDGYEKTGWEIIKENPPTYFYIKGGNIKRIPRYKFMKKNMPKLLKSFNPNLSGDDNMYLNGFSKIWNCGTIKVKWSN